ncbi:MAG: hypothetical protein ACUVRT_05395 [Armatimonadota bacterium]
MKKAWLSLLVVGGALLCVWLGYGAFVYLRNPFPRFSLPPAPPAVTQNAYTQLVEYSTQIQQGSKLAALEQMPDYGSVPQKQEVVKANRDLLLQIRQALTQPAQVTHLDYQPGDPTTDNYRQVARLFAAEAKLLEQQGMYGQALGSYLDGFTYLHKILTGGNVLHLTHYFLGSTVLFEAVPSLLTKLSASDAQRGARRLEELLYNEYPLPTLLAQDFRIWLIGWQRTVRAQAMRGFRLDLPQSGLEREILYMPKAPLSQAAQQYAQQWIENASRPYPEQQMVPYPPALQKLGRDLVVRSPADIALQVARYTYVQTRLRLLYTALRLEANRKARGRYPTHLRELGDSPYFVAPFANKPFVYRPQGNRYVLYSVGPNTIDDGGLPFPEGRLRREQPGDFGLIPYLPRRP